MPPIHPDLTAARAVDACGGDYSMAERESKYAQGHMDALEAACKAVAKPDALMAEMLEALKAVEESSTTRLLHRVRQQVRAAIAAAEASPSQPIGGR